MQTVHLPEREESPQVAVPGPHPLPRAVVDVLVLHEHEAARRVWVSLVHDVGQDLAVTGAAAEEDIGVHKVQPGLADDQAPVAVLDATGVGMARDGLPLQREVPLGWVPWKPKQDKKKVVSTSSCAFFPQVTPHVTTRQLFPKPCLQRGKSSPTSHLTNASPQ